MEHLTVLHRGNRVQLYGCSTHGLRLIVLPPPLALAFVMQARS
jgi:hypothetical protein